MDHIVIVRPVNMHEAKPLSRYKRKEKKHQIQMSNKTVLSDKALNACDLNR